MSYCKQFFRILHHILHVTMHNVHQNQIIIRKFHLEIKIRYNRSIYTIFSITFIHSVKLFHSGMQFTMFRFMIIWVNECKLQLISSISCELYRIYVLPFFIVHDLYLDMGTSLCDLSKNGIKQMNGFKFLFWRMKWTKLTIV